MLPKRFHLRLVLLLATLLFGRMAGAGETNSVFYLRAETAFQRAEKNYSGATNFTVAAEELARVSFDLAELATNEMQRAEISRRGIAACRDWLAREPKAAAAHYYLAMNVGELAQAEAPSLAAYKMVHEVEREFTAAAELDVRYDFAGPARNLGELYFQAPSWPLSVGSKHKAREWLERAAALAPEYPENLLCLAEAQLQWRQLDEAAKTLRRLAANWPAAVTNFTGEAREKDWREWTARRVAATAEYRRLAISQ
jgi:tetratricopeptide (TPR) repeat protein